jgi:hypothetical protein
MEVTVIGVVLDRTSDTLSGLANVAPVARPVIVVVDVNA